MEIKLPDNLSEEEKKRLVDILENAPLSGCIRKSNVIDKVGFVIKKILG